MQVYMKPGLTLWQLNVGPDFYYDSYNGSHF